MRTVLSSEIPEGTTPTLSFMIVDKDGVGFRPEVVTLTLFNSYDGTIINSREAQDVLNTNGVTIGSNGAVVYQMVKEDNSIFHTFSAQETHIAFFEWSWNSGLFVGSHEIELHVRNLAKKI